MQNGREREEHLDAISNYHSESTPAGLDGTCAQILGSDTMQTWESQAGQKLLCHGRPGGGKTTVATMVANRLVEKYDGDDHVGIVRIYLRADNPDLKALDGTGLQRAILRQLCEKQPVLLETIPELCDSWKRRRSRPGNSQLLQALIRAIDEFTRVFLVIDAIDDFGTSMADTRVLLKFLLSAIRLRPKVNLLLTSLASLEVMESELTEELTGWKELEIRALDKDIACYINSRVTDIAPSWRQGGHVPGEIVRDVIHMCDGT